MHYVYLLHLDEVGGKKYYIGYTSDLTKRMKEHIEGNTQTTRKRNPKLIYYEAFEDKYVALKREKGIKNSGSVYMALMKRLGLQ